MGLQRAVHSCFVSSGHSAENIRQTVKSGFVHNGDDVPDFSSCFKSLTQLISYIKQKSAIE